MNLPQAHSGRSKILACLNLLCGNPCNLCVSGGEAVEAVSTAATKAAAEAATGSWLKELQSGVLPCITAPGLTQGWFGPWQEGTTQSPDSRSGQSIFRRHV